MVTRLNFFEVFQKSEISKNAVSERWCSDSKRKLSFSQASAIVTHIPKHQHEEIIFRIFSWLKTRDCYLWKQVFATGSTFAKAKGYLPFSNKAVYLSLGDFIHAPHVCWV